MTTLVGDGGNNSLVGSGGGDSISGAAGNDTLDGGTGLDTLAGGIGNDTYFIRTYDGGQNSISLQSSPGDHIGQGLTLSFLPQPGEFSTNVSDVYYSDQNQDGLIDSIGLSYHDPHYTHFWTFRFSTRPLGTNLALGTYTDAQDLLGHPYLSVTGDGNGSSHLFGSFTITDIDIDYSGPSPVLLDFSASFEQHDGSPTAPALVGTVNYHYDGTGPGTIDTVVDTVVENPGEGTDTVQAWVSVSLPANVENLVLNGTDPLSGTGNASNNSISGNTGDNILDGSAGADTMAGGQGNDTYIIDDSGDVIQEASNEGWDLVQSSVDYGLGSDVENLVLTGTAINGSGNTLDNSIVGDNANNVLSGGQGNDTLDGGIGVDTLIGGLGDDTYFIRNYEGGTVDTVQENSGEGTDTVQAWVNYTLPANVENLVLNGTSDLSGTGNASNNSITGNYDNGYDSLDGGAGADTLSANAGTLLGGAGDDSLIGGFYNNRLDGGSGNDTLVGDTGQDTFVFSSLNDLSASGDHIRDLTTNDTIDLSSIGGLHFIGSAAFSGSAGEVRYAYTSLTRSILIDTNGDRIADKAIVLDNAPLVLAESSPGSNILTSVPTVTIDAFGTTVLTAAANNFYLQDRANAPVVLTYQGSNVTAGQFGAWTPIGAEINGSGYELAWKNGAADQYRVWSIDANGAYVATLMDAVSGSNATFESAEILFQQDLNGDGQIGVVNHAPVLITPSGANLTASAGQSFQASALFSGSDADNDALIYWFYDNTAGGGHFEVGGVTKADHVWFSVSQAQLSQVVFKAGPGGSSDDLYAFANDGQAWSNEQLVQIAVPAVNHAPVLSTPSGTNLTASAGQTFQASALFSGSDADNDPLTYWFNDNTAGGGHFEVAGVTKAASTWFSASQAQLSQVVFKAGPGDSSDDLYGYVNDGQQWSNEPLVHIAVPAVQPTDNSGLKINVSYDASVAGAPAGFKTTLESVIQYFENTFADPITINIAVGYGEINNGSIPSGAIAANISAYDYSTYGSMRAALAADATSSADAQAIASLTPNPFLDSQPMVVTQAEMKALHLDPNGSLYSLQPFDGYLGFNSGIAFDFDASDGISAGTYDFAAGVAHELTEVMGRSTANGRFDSSTGTSIYAPLDLFHYSAPGARSFSGTAAGYFSYDGGNTHLTDFNTSPSGDFGDWANNAGNDEFRAFFPSGVKGNITSTDLQLMDVLGYHLKVQPAVNHAPVLSTPSGANLTASAGQSFQASALFSGSDADNDPLTYWFYDNASNGGHFEVAGAAKAALTWFSVAQAQLSQVVFKAGPGGSSDDLYGYVHDGQQWSNEPLVHIAVPAVNHVPVLSTPSGTNLTASAGQSFQASALFSGSDADNDPLIYWFYDNASDGGHFEVAGVTKVDHVWFSVSQAQLNQVVFKAGPGGTSDDLYGYVNDGQVWSNEPLVHVAVPAVNHAPVLSTPSGADLTATAGQSIQASALFSGSDADNDPLTYWFYDNASGGGHFEVAGVTKAALTWFSVSQAQLNQVVFKAGPGSTSDDLYGYVNDGQVWSNEQLVHIAVPAANHAPVLSTPSGADLTATAGQSIQASALFSGTDADNDPLTYWFYDNASGGGHFEVAGVTKVDHVWFSVAQAQLGQVVFKAGPGGTSDDLYGYVNDGQQWSNEPLVQIAVPAANHAPVLATPSGANLTATAGQSFQASALFSGSDADNDTLTYWFYDNTSGGGHFEVAGAAKAPFTWFSVTQAQLNQVLFKAGPAGTNDDLYAFVNDGQAWSNEPIVQVAVTASNQAPVLTTPSGAQVSSVSGQSFQASALFSATDAEADPLTYWFYDDAAGGGHFEVAGVPKADHVWFSVAQAQLSQAVFKAGPAGTTDDLYAFANDGQAWSNEGWVHLIA